MFVDHALDLPSFGPANRWRTAAQGAPAPAELRMLIEGLQRARRLAAEGQPWAEALEAAAEGAGPAGSAGAVRKVRRPRKRGT